MKQIAHIAHKFLVPPIDFEILSNMREGGIDSNEMRVGV